MRCLYLHINSTCIYMYMYVCTGTNAIPSMVTRREYTKSYVNASGKGREWRPSNANILQIEYQHKTTPEPSIVPLLVTWPSVNMYCTHLTSLATSVASIRLRILAAKSTRNTMHMNSVKERGNSSHTNSYVIPYVAAGLINRIPFLLSSSPSLPIPPHSLSFSSTMYVKT